MIREGLTFDDVLLVPQKGIVDSRKKTDIHTSLGPIKLGIPVISANMPSVTGPAMSKAMYQVGGFGVLHRFNTIAEAVRDFQDAALPDSNAAVSIGVNEGYERVESLYLAGARIFFLDVAHGDQAKVYKFIQGFITAYPNLYLFAGNIATRDAALRMSAAGVHGVKVGIGPGAACTTREVTGFGVPQLTAIMDVYDAIGDVEDITIIADGGIKTSGDIVKALAAGADVVMLGSMLAGCDEAPLPGIYYGNASAHVNGHNAPEGVYGSVERIGSVTQLMKKLSWGIRSGVAYGGAYNLTELRENAEWVRVSPYAAHENRARV